MQINEIIKKLNSYLLIVKTKCGKSVKTVIHSLSASDARLIASDIWGAKNLQSVTQINVTATESFIPLRKRKKIKPMTPQDHHSQYQRIFTRKYFNALQFPKVTDHDKQVALDNAQTKLKRMKFDQERRAKGLKV